MFRIELKLKPLSPLTYVLDLMFRGKEKRGEEGREEERSEEDRREERTFSSSQSVGWLPVPGQ